MDLNEILDKNVCTKDNQRLYLPSTMRTAHPDFARQYRKTDSMPCEQILPRDCRLRDPGLAVPANISTAEQAGDEHDVGVGAGALSSWRVGQSREFMERHLDQPMRIAVLAAMAGVSISHFFKLFKEDTGCAPVVYMTRLKMDRACDWLVTTDSSIKLIAAELGYHDPLYFSRVFKSLVGMAPKAYRRAKRNGRVRSISATVR